MSISYKNILSVVLVTFLIIISIISVFTVSETFSDDMLISKWYMTELIGIICGVFIFIILILAKKISVSSHTSAWMELGILAVCTVQASLMLIQTTGLIDKYGDFTSGSFDNTAGFVACVCISWPCGWRLMKRNMNVTTYTVAVCKTICLFSIFVAGSRAGLICILFISLCFIFPKRRGYRLLSFTLLIAVVLLCSFFLKRDSSRGRWFICERTTELIAEKPLSGWGIHGFEKQYMPRQAAYFKAHPNSEYAMLADGIKHPLNEYLNLAVNFGLLGLGVLACFMFLTCRYYLRHRSAEGKVCLCVLLSAAILSLFSYPFCYPFTWMACLLALLVIYRNGLLRITEHKNRRKWICAAVLSCLMSFVPSLIQKIRNDTEWAALAEHARYCVSEKVLNRYETLYPKMHDNPYFLYNYSAEEYEAGKYGKALTMAKECLNYYSDYDLEMLMADCYQSLNNSKMALCHYQNAHNMIPSRLMPYYGQFEMYRQMNDSKKSKVMAEIILKKPVKVKSRVTQMIRDEVSSFVKGSTD